MIHGSVSLGHTIVCFFLSLPLFGAHLLHAGEIGGGYDTFISQFTKCNRLNSRDLFQVNFFLTLHYLFFNFLFCSMLHNFWISSFFFFSMYLLGFMQ